MTKKTIGVVIGAAILVAGAVILSIASASELHTFGVFLLDKLNSVPADAWSVILEVIVGAVAASTAAAVIKRWINRNEKKLTKGRTMAIVIYTSLGAGVLGYLHGVPEFAPWFALVQGALVYITSQPFYFLFLKQLFARIGAWLTNELAKAAIQSEAESSAVPADGLPLTNAKTIDDILA